MYKNLLGCSLSLISLIFFIVATYLSVLWFSWKLVLIFWLFLSANNIERLSEKIFEDFKK